ncbi:MAG: phenylalanine--tRNA ligase subunit alpha [Coriobacteriales bacterium]|jgi:phenylalanyl-tRNA synthetase alpha chain|nr:phenylalanine--tRNA ligase subunit alpha [Coriobacteriales bacterium]
MVTEEIEELRTSILAQITEADNSSELEQLRVAVLGKKGSLTVMLRTLGKVPAAERAVVGRAANQLRDELEAAFAIRRNTLVDAELDAQIAAGAIDITLPGRQRLIGSQHLINQIRDEICDIFRGIGYTVVSGPEVETDYYNFTALNTPADHPSRGLQDTLYIRDRSGSHSTIASESEVMLRTQTSGVQVRTMEMQKPPIYVLVPGRVFRRDAPDPTHTPQFTQIEGLVVDKGITFADLKGTMDYLCKQVFGLDRQTRFRTHFFPFTEPSAEVDVSCGICGGTGCRSCKGTGWLEILGCGMVDPNVFGFVGIDPEEYSGFAFGIGMERTACLKYNVPDLRMLLEGDVRFLRQF